MLTNQKKSSSRPLPYNYEPEKDSCGRRKGTLVPKGGGGGGGGDVDTTKDRLFDITALLGS